jgi:prepilin-type N-terminal cleavage/methylation domain-containing protein
MIRNRHKPGFALLEVMVAIAVVSMTSMSVIGLQTGLMSAVSKNSQTIRHIFLIKNTYASYAERQFKGGLSKEIGEGVTVDEVSKDDDSWLHTLIIRALIPSVPERDLGISWYVVKKPTREKK